MSDIFNPGIIQLTSKDGSVIYVPANGIGAIVDLSATGSGGGSLTLTDGVNTVSGVTNIAVTGGTVGGTTPNATLLVIGGVSSFSGDGVLLNNSLSTGAVTASLTSQARNLVFAGPTSGANATPTFRSLVGADLPNPSASTLGGVESIVAVAHNFLTAISTSGVPSQAQPAFADISGQAATAQLPTLASGNIFVGNVSNVAASVAMSADATLANTGALTLATVNANTGSFGSSTAIPNFTVNGKGLMTAAGTSVVIAPAGTLTGTTLASNVVTSSITTLGSNASLPGSPTTTTQAAGTSNTTVATTAYTDSAVAAAIAGVNPAIAVQAATTAVLPNTPTYNNGVSGVGATLTAGVTNTALVVDGFTPTLNQRILVKNQASAFQNGVYFVSQIAALGLAWILTRALDYDMPSDINNTGAIPVTNGTVNIDTSWVLTSQVTTVGTDSLTYTQFTINPTTILTNTLNSGNIFVGNASNVATGVAMSGGATLSNAGVITIVTNANLTGPITSVGNATSIASQTGTGSKFVVDTSPTLITPALGTPSSGNLANCTFPTLNQNTTGTAANDHLSILANTEVAITTTATATINKQHSISGTTANYTVTLPAVSGNTGRFIGFRVLPTTTKIFTIKGNGAENIDGQNTRLMWAGESATLYCDGSAWFKIAGKTIPMIGNMGQTASAPQTIATATVTTVTVDTVIDDPTGAMVDTTNNQILIVRPGNYLFNASASYRPFVTANSPRVITQITKNGAFLANSEVPALIGTFASPFLSVPRTGLAAGDALKLITFQNSGANQTTAGTNLNFLSAVEIPTW